MCEQVFDEIVDTIVMKVQRQIDESRRIAKDHDGEPDLDIEVRANPGHFKIAAELQAGHHPRGRPLAEPLPEGQDAWPFRKPTAARAKAYLDTDQAILVGCP